MAGNWDDEDGSDASSTVEDSTKAGAVGAVGAASRRKFDDEEEDDDAVLDSWDAAEDSEVEREKLKKVAEAKEKAEAEAQANKKSKTQRMKDKIAERQKQQEGDSDVESVEDEVSKRARLAEAQKEADLKHAEDLFAGDVGSVPSSRKAVIKGSTVPDPRDPDNLIDLSTIALFDPKTKTQFEQLRTVMAPILSKNSQKPHYTLFLVEFAKQLAKDLPSDQIKKVASTLTALSNEKLKEEKAQDKGAKKTKAAKTKTTLAIARPSATDTTAYDDNAFDDDDFM